MMPWEHVVVGYIGYSVAVRLWRRPPPTALETVVVVFASLLPDLIDKPLAWQFNIFSSGHALGHSIFLAAALAPAVLLAAHRSGRPRMGVAFAFGYLLHLPGDVVPQSIRSGENLTDRVLWPLHQDGSGYDAGFRGELTDNLVAYAGWFIDQLTSGSPDPYLFVLLGIMGFGLLLWVADGMPIARETYAMVRDSTRKPE